MFARIILEGGARRFQIVAEMAVEFRAKTAMFADKLGQRRNGFKAGIFFKACALEAFIVVNRPFLRIRNRRGGVSQLRPAGVSRGAVFAGVVMASASFSALSHISPEGGGGR